LNETEPVEFELRLGWIKKFVNAHSSELLKIVFPLWFFQLAHCL